MTTHRALLTAAVLLLSVHGAARAEGDDVFTLSADTSLVRDNNLFRLSSSANTLALIGRDSAAEQINITTLGVRAAKSYSLQRFELGASVVDQRYQNFSYLNSVANNYDAAWRWSLTPSFHGNLVNSRRESLNSFVDVQGYNTRSQRVNYDTRWDGQFEIDGVWRALAGVSQGTQKSLQNQSTEADTSTNGADLGVAYAFASGSTLSYTLRNSKGQYLNRVLPNTSLLDDTFNQVDHEFRIRWVMDGITTAGLHATGITRTHPTYSQRDYNGIAAGANIKVNLSGKTSLAVDWSRELSAYQDGITNYSQIDRLVVGPVWQIGAKTMLRLRHEIALRDYLGSPTPLAATTRTDTTRDTTLSLDWQPSTNVTLSASLQDARRTSTVTGLDYQSTQTTVSARFAY
jgi:exopolysaccharide biosynthesis operon protein EpsL